MSNWDHLVFGVYLLVVAIVGIVASRRSKESDDYFLAGRNLTWWIIGGSLIAANISTHHFIGMSGRGFEIGLAIASYEWIAAIVLVLYGKFFLPYYLKSRITTMPEFLEKRFDHKVRLAYAVICLIAYIVIELAAVLYTGSLAINQVAGLDFYTGLAILCVVGGGYTIYGGFKSVAYTDIIQVTVLILGGLTVTVLGLQAVGGATPGYSANIFSGLKAVLDGSPDKFHMVRAWDDPELPWIGVFFGGMFAANIAYWGCNQFITQRSLAARSLWHGQMGVVFAGFLKLLVPVLVVLPGIIAFRLYNADTGLLKEQYQLAKCDLAFPTLVNQLLPIGFRGLVMAGLMGCVMSHIASMLSASSSILTFDIYKSYVNREASSHDLIRFGRYSTLAVLILATGVGYLLKNLNAIFLYIQTLWLCMEPTMCALFLAGFFYKRANAKGSLIGLIVGPTFAALVTAADKTGLCAQLVAAIPQLDYLVRGVTPFQTRAILDVLLVWFIIWIFRTRGEQLPPEATIDRTLAPEVAASLAAVPWYLSFRLWGTALVLTVVGLYIYFF